MLAVALALAAPYPVQPYYVYPADQPMHPEYVAAIEKSIVEVQDWYRQKVGSTFRLLPLKIRRGDVYPTMRGGPSPSEEVRSDVTKLPAWWESLEAAVGSYPPKTVSWVFAQGGGGYAAANLIKDHVGIGVFGDWVLEPLSGVREPNAIHSGYATWQVQGGTPMGTTVHELGHAFGLHHPDKYEGKSIMRWHGDYPYTGLLPHEIMILKESPYFVANAYDRDAPHVDFENADVMRHGETVQIRGKGFSRGDVVEFRDLRHSVRRPGKLVEDRLEVTVPPDMGPGYVRVWRGGRRSNVVPVNFYPPEVERS
jgi:hypothetical protein